MIPCWSRWDLVREGGAPLAGELNRNPVTVLLGWNRPDESVPDESARLKVVAAGQSIDEEVGFAASTALHSPGADSVQ